MVVDQQGSVGWSNSIAVDSNGNPRISYEDGGNNDLKYSYYDGDQWHTEIVDSEGLVGGQTSLDLDSKDLPHIIYVDYGNDLLKYTHYVDGYRQMQEIDWIGSSFPELALDSQDVPHICYHNDTNGELKYAFYDGNQWTIDVIDSDGDVGASCSISLDNNDHPHISYQDETNYDLKYIYYDGEQWHKEVVDSEGDVGYSTSIYLENDRMPHISYLDDTKSVLKHAMIFEKEPPKSTMDAIDSYWFIEEPLHLTATATDNVTGVSYVELWYRYSGDNNTWKDWTLFERTVEQPFSFDFTFPDGDGYYEFHSAATDRHGNMEVNPEADTIRCGYDTEKPTANAGIDNGVSIGKPVIFDAGQSRDNLGISNFSWHFDDNGLQVLYGLDPSHFFSDIGVFEVILEVVDMAGHTDLDTVLVTVYDDTPPVPDGGDDRVIMQGETVTFDGSLSTDNIGIVEYSWSLIYEGEEEFLSGETVEFTFHVPGFYVITLAVTDVGDNTETDIFNLTVRDSELPETQVTIKGTTIKPGDIYEMELNETVIFDASGSTDNVGIVNFTWEIGGPGGLEELEGEKAAHVFTGPGKYTVMLRVVDAEGNTGDLEFEVYVTEVVVEDDDEDDDVTPRDDDDDDGNEMVEGQGGSGIVVWVVVVVCVAVMLLAGGVLVIMLTIRKKRRENKNETINPPQMI